jgi:hypothetical protein
MGRPGRIFMISLLFATTFQCGAQMVIADEQRSDYRIIIPTGADTLESKAAFEFQRYVKDIAGVELPVMSDLEPLFPHEVIIGKSSRLHMHRIKSEFRENEQDGFLIRTKDEKLFIAGGSPEGTLNGVYTFLENYLDCRFYSADARIIPVNPNITLPKINDRQVPAFVFRELYFPGRYDPEYRAWHKLHSHHDGSWGMWVHTFDDLIPAKKYFKEHPEYFSEINGKRVANGQLCLSNPDVFDTVVKNLSQRIEKKPEAHYWSVSQNDNFLACQCENCGKIAQEYGGESGLMIWFVNRVAALFPDKTISTLAYQYTRSAPAGIKPLPNVNIMLCSIECNRSLPIADDPTSASFVQDVREWTKLTGNILIWDYVVQFRNYISPFPNLRVLQPNLEFFAGHECRLMFQQGSGASLSEFVDLRSYLIAKLLWDPKADPEEIINDFLYGYYGQAAPFISEYISTMHDLLESSGDNLWIYGYPYSGFDSYLQPAYINIYKEYFDKAESAVNDNPEILDRVRFARLPLDFAILDISLHNAGEGLSWFTGENGKFELNDDMVNLLDTFTNRCNRLDVKMLNEQGLTPDEYKRKISQYLIKSSDRHLGIQKDVNLLSTFSPKYEAGGAGALTDGLRGIDDYHFNWLGFEGENLEAIIDLDSAQTISQVSVDFLQDVQAWIFLPKKLTVWTSADGEEFIKSGTVGNITPDNKPGVFIQTYSIPAGGVQARYIKVRAEALKTCPGWHIGSGKNSWIFTDEIVIK